MLASARYYRGPHCPKVVPNRYSDLGMIVVPESLAIWGRGPHNAGARISRSHWYTSGAEPPWSG